MTPKQLIAVANGGIADWLMAHKTLADRRYSPAGLRQERFIGARSDNHVDLPMGEVDGVPA